MSWDAAMECGAEIASQIETQFLLKRVFPSIF